jgi:SAM-dependent methyltransferase
MQIHRAETGSSYRGLPTHAAPGVHEFAMDVIGRRIPSGSRVADLGAGSGAFTARLRDARYEVIAVDISPASDDVVAADICDDLVDALGAESLDAAVALEVVEHLGDPEGFLDQVHASLRDGGALLISTPNVVHPYSRLKFLLRGQYWLFGGESFWTSGHSTPFPSWLWVQWLQRAGFIDVASGLAGRATLKGMRGVALRLLGPLARHGGGSLGSVDSATTLFLLAWKPRAHEHHHS